MKGKVVVLILIIILEGTFFTSTCDAFQGPYAGINGQAVFVNDVELDVDDITFAPGFGGGVEGGYDFGLHRLEGEVAYRNNSVDQVKIASLGRGSIDGKGDISLTSLMLNLYLDFDNETKFIPYAGLGIGIANVSFNNIGASGIELLDDDSSKLAAQVTLGIGYIVSDFLIIDLGYRYFSTDEMDFVDDFGHKVGEERYDSHNIMIGFRINVKSFKF
ncbi:MAG: porin family protein [Nitrospirae bacterium]|nr:porin family protein [Nitrospirota bacterium]